ncbi:MAG: hypothetical protein V1788_01830 [Nanoarchaeota archaeon]
MKVITGTKDDEVQIRQGEDLKTNLNSIPTGRALLLENPDGGLEENLIVGKDLDSFRAMRFNPKNKRVESLIYPFTNYNLDTMELIEPEVSDFISEDAAMYKVRLKQISKRNLCISY